MQAYRYKSIVILSFVVCCLLLLAGCAPKEIPPPQMKPPAKIALVLGAGASRGFTHIGAIKILEANRVPIHLIVGTSAGSFIGCLYAYGFNAFQLQSLSFSMEKGDIVDLTMPDKGFIKGEKLESYVNHLVNNTPIEKMRIPFYAVTTDIQSGEEVVFASGNTGMAVRASCSIPGIFQPVKIGERCYVDGGLVSPVAVDYARKMGADLVIAVDISAVADNTAAPDDNGNDYAVRCHHVLQDIPEPTFPGRRGYPPKGKPYRLNGLLQTPRGCPGGGEGSAGSDAADQGSDRQAEGRRKALRGW